MKDELGNATLGEPSPDLCINYTTVNVSARRRGWPSDPIIIHEDPNLLNQTVPTREICLLIATPVHAPLADKSEKRNMNGTATEAKHPRILIVYIEGAETASSLTSSPADRCQDL